jgi:hypothetical protein
VKRRPGGSEQKDGEEQMRKNKDEEAAPKSKEGQRRWISTTADDRKATTRKLQFPAHNSGLDSGRVD